MSLCDWSWTSREEVDNVPGIQRIASCSVSNLACARSTTGLDDQLGRRLHQLDEHALAGSGRGGVTAWVDEADVVAGAAAPDAARREPHALRGEPGDRRW